ncbi:MAG: hypothetical protein B7Z75_07315 [Acidocella sp. 20-57-95]|nr:MAG: hypothetical protein B7Z75_07315 [Acidocella sp. 20-57-95]HQT63516.1 porin [Acidocella sp.]
MNSKTKLTRVSMVALAAASVLVIRPGFAHAATTAAQLQAEINQLQAQINALSTQQDAINAQVADNALAVKKLATATKATKNGWGMVSKGNVLPDFVSDDGSSSFKIIGRLQGDLTMRQVPGAVSKGQAAALNGKSTSIDESFRRVRLGVQGQFAKYWVYKFQYDFLGSAAAGITDAYFGYNRKFGNVGNEFLVGNQFVAFGQHTPSNYITFMEDRLDTSVFRPGRQLGISGRDYTKYWNAWYSLTNGRGAAGTGSGTLAVSGQIGFNLINTSHTVIHIGNSLLYNRFAGGTGTPGTAFKSAPDAHFYGANLIATPSLIDVVSNFVYSPSLVVKYGPASFRANYYMENTIDHSNKGKASDLTAAQATFSGWAVQGDYILTGETRPFDDASGAFLGIKPLHPITDGGWGAFQVAARLDSADLNDVHHGVQGGRETNVTFAINWFPTSYTRVDLDYIKVLKVVGGAYNGYDPSIVAARMQFVF